MAHHLSLDAGTRNKRKERRNSPDQPPLFASFACFATRSLREPPFRRSTPCVVDTLAECPASRCKHGQGLAYALRALVPLEEVRYFGPAHAVRDSRSQGF